MRSIRYLLLAASRPRAPLLPLDGQATVERIVRVISAPVGIGDSVIEWSRRIAAGCKRATLSTDWKGTREPWHRSNRCPQATRRNGAGLSYRTAQYRSGAGAAGRDPRQQRGALPRLRFSRAGAFLRADPPADLRDRPQPDPHRQARLAGDAEDVPARRRRHRRHDGRAVSRPPRGRSDDHHQRRRTTGAPSTTSRSGAS